MKKEYKFIGKCMFLVKNKTLVIGDLHLGYEDSLINKGILINKNYYRELELELDKIIRFVGKLDKIIILGDIKHSFSKNISGEWKEILDLLNFLKDKCNQIVLIKGNHDNYLKNMVRNEKIIVDAYYILENYCFIHGDKDYPVLYGSEISTWVMGHAHPAITIGDQTKSEKYKCFLVGNYKGKEVIILPSFSENNQGSDPREYDLGLSWKFDLNSFKTYVVNGQKEALEFGKLKKI